MITKPMLAASVDSVEDIKFPVEATPKLDGIRCLKINGKALSRKFKDIPNHYVRGKLLELPDGLDGELVCPDKTFNEIQSLIMTEDGEPEFHYVVFDYVKDDVKKGYMDRLNDLLQLQLPNWVVPLLPIHVENLERLTFIEKNWLECGYEGVMIRSPSSPYKCGRSTMREGYLAKIKQFKDAEAVVTGFEEKLHNANEATKDELGHTKRSKHQANLIPAGTLGKFLVKDITTGAEFGIGTGMNDATRKEVWDNREKYLGKIVNYQYQPSGMKDKPRFPSFRGFRDPRDMS